MAVALALSGFVVLVVALVLFLRTSRQASPAGATTNRRTVIILTFLGLLLALASQLPVFQG